MRWRAAPAASSRRSTPRSLTSDDAASARSRRRDGDLCVETSLAALRNTTAFDFLDRCAVSLPIHAPGGAAVGLMIAGESMAGRALLGIAAALEQALRH